MKQRREERGERRGESGQWPVASGQSFFSFPRSAWERTALDAPRRCSLSANWPLATGHRPLRHAFPRSHAPRGNALAADAPRRVPPSALRLPPSGFTLVEMLVTISLVGMLAAMVFGALSMARESGREAATKATIAKLNSIIMRRYESYMTRRVPISTAGLTPAQAAQNRLAAIRDIMRMEMPDRGQDVPRPVGGTLAMCYPPIVLPNQVNGVDQQVPMPALGMLYYNRFNFSPPMVGGVLQTDGKNGAAELLYMIVSMGSPETMEQFSQSEIGDTDNNGYPEFLDGWGRPIFFLRWAPGFTTYSDIQKLDDGTGLTDPQINHHDPFDPRRVEDNALQLFPLIYSAGPNGKLGLSNQKDYYFGTTHGLMFTDAASNIFLQIGIPTDHEGDIGDFQDNITNHHIEAR